MNCIGQLIHEPLESKPATANVFNARLYICGIKAAELFFFVKKVNLVHFTHRKISFLYLSK